jgi:phage gpG-like protein
MRFEKSVRRTAALSVIVVAVAATSSALAARVLNVRDEGKLHFITSNGSEIIDEGEATGTVPGNVRVHFIYNGEPAVSARFTIYGHSGSISGRASGRLSNLTSPDPSFRGAFTITGGSRRYAHIHGTGELFGVFTRRGKNKYSLVVQTIGKDPY